MAQKKKAKKKAKAKAPEKVEFYGDIEAVVRVRLRTSATVKGEPTNEKLLEILQNQRYHDILDEETLEFIKVEDFEQFDQDSEEE